MVYFSAGSRLPSIVTTKAKVVGAGAILRPISSGNLLFYFSSSLHFEVMLM